jgi:hypothetical protein
MAPTSSSREQVSFFLLCSATRHAWPVKRYKKAHLSVVLQATAHVSARFGHHNHVVKVG